MTVRTVGFALILTRQSVFRGRRSNRISHSYRLSLVHQPALNVSPFKQVQTYDFRQQRMRTLNTTYLLREAQQILALDSSCDQHPLYEILRQTLGQLASLQQESIVDFC